MSLLLKGKIFVPNVNQIRCKSKINIRKPQTERLPRRLFKALMEPIVIPRKIDKAVKCSQRFSGIEKEKSEVNLYEEFLFKRYKEDLETKKMIVICQQLPCKVRERTKIENKFLNMDMKFVKMHNKIIRRAVEGTKRENLMPLLSGSNVYILSDELRIQEMMAGLKKAHHLVVLGVLTENHILSREDLVRLSETDLDTARGELVSLLSHGASKTHSLLGSHQENLVRNLEQYIKQCGGGTEVAGSGSPIDSPDTASSTPEPSASGTSSKTDTTKDSAESPIASTSTEPAASKTAEQSAETAAETESPASATSKPTDAPASEVETQSSPESNPPNSDS